MKKVESQYSIWTLPKEQWSDPLKEIDISKIKNRNVKNIQKIREKNQKLIKDRLKAFNTPIDPELLNKIILS